MGPTGPGPSDEVVGHLRRICLAFPEATERPFGGHTAPAFRVRDKLFLHCHEDGGAFTCKAAPGEQGLLVAADPGRFFVPAYVGHRGWVGVRLDGDVVPYLLAAARGGLADLPAPAWRDEAVLCVVVAATGYPEAPRTGSVIGLPTGELGQGVQIFHAGTARRADGALIASGGRVLNVCARGRDLAEARDRAYAVVDRIDWPEGFHRRDIGWRALQKG